MKNSVSVPASYQGVALVAPVTIPYQRYSEQGAQWFIGRALREMIDQAGIEKSAVDGLAISSFSLKLDSAITLTQYFDMTLRWIQDLPYGGASGILGLRRAARAIQAGDAEIVACIGADTSSPNSFSETVGKFSTFTIDASYPYGAAGPNLPFSLITQHYMDTYGVTREDFGRLCLAQRYNAQHFEHALLGKKSLSMDDYLGARQIAGPLHLFDCVMPCAGAESFLIMSIERARDLGLDYAEVMAADELHNAFPEDPIQFRGGWANYRDQLYQSAGIGPEDVDLLQTYDDYPVINFLQMEDLGFCEKGQAARFVAENSTRFDGGGLPQNTSGGQLSCGQAGSAAGYMGIVETMRQLAGVAEGRQVPDADVGMISGYGMINYDRGLCSAAAILKRGS
jgi:acetyl-CoA acetyltransferase